MLVALIVVGVAVAVAFTVFVYLAEKKRREAIVRWAATNGWTYTDEDDRWADAWRGAPFGEGHSREAANVMEEFFSKIRDSSDLKGLAQEYDTKIDALLNEKNG